ncbi:hypothetical protein ACWEQO_12345 [Streptomyces sp. NPDC004051]
MTCTDEIFGKRNVVGGDHAGNGVLERVVRAQHREIEHRVEPSHSALDGRPLAGVELIKRHRRTHHVRAQVPEHMRSCHEHRWCDLEARALRLAAKSEHPAEKARCLPLFGRHEVTRQTALEPQKAGQYVNPACTRAGHGGRRRPRLPRQ